MQRHNLRLLEQYVCPVLEEVACVTSCPIEQDMVVFDPLQSAGRWPTMKELKKRVAH